MPFQGIELECSLDFCPFPKYLPEWIQGQGFGEHAIFAGCLHNLYSACTLLTFFGSAAVSNLSVSCLILLLLSHGGEPLL